MRPLERKVSKLAVLKEFKYERPDSLEQLSQLLALNKGMEPCYLAGGTDLLVAMRKGKDNPQLVIDIKGIPNLKGISKVQENTLWIGALTSIHSLEIENMIKEGATALYEGAQNLGSWQVRNRGTIGGNLGNGAPTADTAAPLLALEAEVLAWSPDGERRIAMENFWLGAGKTCLSKEEIITGVEIPLDQSHSSAYSKLGPRKAMDIAIASSAVVLKINQGLVEDVRIALGGAGSTPVRARSAEDFLRGREAIQDNFKEAGRLAGTDSNPRTSSRATREYRLSIIPVLVERTILSANQRQEALHMDKGGKG